MFSEYASRLLGKSQRVAPLFQGDVNGIYNGGGPVLGWVTESLPSSIIASQELSDEDDPPLDLVLQAGVAGVSLAGGEDMASPNQQYRDDEHEPTRSAFIPPDEELGLNGRNDRQNVPLALPRVLKPAEGNMAQSIETMVALLYTASIAITLAASSVAYYSNNIVSDMLRKALSQSLEAIGPEFAVSLLVAAAWLSALISNARFSVRAVALAAPLILALAGAGGLVASMHYSLVHSVAHAALRIFSVMLILASLLWGYTLRAQSQNLSQATEMVNLATTVVFDYPHLMILPVIQMLMTLVFVPFWTLMIIKVFYWGKLGVVLAVATSFSIFWTTRILLALEKTLIAGITAIWFEDYSSQSPSPCWTSNDQPINLVRVLRKAFEPESRSSIAKSARRFVLPRLGSCCLSGLTLLLWQVPTYLLSSRLVAVLPAALIPSRFKGLTSPLLVPYATIVNLPILVAVEQVENLNAGNSNRDAYRLAKLLLLSTRIIFTALAAVATWIYLDRSSSAGSAYTCIFVVTTSIVSWSVLASVDAIFSIVLDALFILSSISAHRLHPELNRVFSTHR